jgi:hypothetical protein
MPSEPDILLDRQYKAIVKANDAIVAAQKKKMAGDYARLLKNLKFTVANAYESYAVDGHLTYEQMQKFNRIKKLNADLKEVTVAGTKPAYGRIKTGLERVADGTFTASLSAIGEVANSNIGRELTSAEIQSILNKPWSGVTLDERIALRRTDLGNRVRQDVMRGIVREDPYEDMVGQLQQTTIKDYARTVQMNEYLGHQVQNESVALSITEADESGIEITKTWVSAGDSKVRDSHAALDGQTVGAQEKFTIPSGPNKGTQADAPGLFGIPEEDYNCRCWVVAGVRIKE